MFVNPWRFLHYSAALVCLAQSPPDLREAARLDQQGKCAESELIYRRALAMPSPSSALLNNAGNHYLTCGDAAQAAFYFDRLLQRLPAHPNANLQLARLAAQRKQPALAEKHLAILSKTNDPQHLFDAGSLYAALGNFRSAQQLWQRLAIQKPGDVDVLLNLGRAAARAGDFARARQALEAALRLRPDDPAVLFELGSAHAASGDSPRAVFLLARAQNQAPLHPGIALALARAAEDAGFFGDAALAFDRYLKLQPADLNAQRDRAYAVANSTSRSQARSQEGMAALAAYVASQPQDPTGHFQLAQLCWKTDPENSLAHLAEAVRLNPALAPAHTARAWLLHRLGRDEDAIAHLETALKLNPKDVRALDQYGLVLLALDRPTQAEKAFRQAAEIDPTGWEVRLHLGRILMEHGHEQEAQRWLEQYKKLRPARQRDPRREPGMIDLATLSPPERRAREIARFRAMVAARPDDALLRLHLAKLLLADGNETDATPEFQALLTKNSDQDVLSQVGRALLDAGRPAQALPFLERSGSLLDQAIALFQTAEPSAALSALDKIPTTEQSAEYLLLKARILDRLGRGNEALKLVAPSPSWRGARPQLVEQAALLLAAHGRYREAAQTLTLAITDAPENRGIFLTESVVLALEKRTAEAIQRLRRIEERWPEWDRPYHLHGLLLPPREAAPLLRTAAALAAPNSAPACRNLPDWLTPPCRGAAQ